MKKLSATQGEKQKKNRAWPGGKWARAIFDTPLEGLGGGSDKDPPENAFRF